MFLSLASRFVIYVSGKACEIMQ